MPSVALNLKADEGTNEVQQRTTKARLSFEGSQTTTRLFRAEVELGFGHRPW